MSINKAAGSHQVVPLPGASTTQFFIAPATPNSGYCALQLPPPGSHTIGQVPWPSPLRPPQTFNHPEIYFTQAPPCLLNNTTTPSSHHDDKPVLTDSSLLRQQQIDDSPPSSIAAPRIKRVKKEPKLSGCKRNEDILVSGDNNKSHPYSINALIDIPSLNKSSRTSSLSSSLSSFRFGGSLSQIWATSLSSLSGKLNNMKSTGNLHADASLPSLNNQYFAFGGSLPELSLTSLTRLLPTSSSSNSSTCDTTSTPGLYTLIQSPLCVYPSQPHLATPFVNANGSITFGSFLSSGSSLCSNTIKADPNDDKQRDSLTPEEPSPPQTTTYSSPSSSYDPPPQPPGNLSTLAYVASVQKNLETSDQFPLMTVTTHLPGHSPIPHNNTTNLSPIHAPPTSCLSPTDDIECNGTSPATRHPFGLIKLEENDQQPFSEFPPDAAKPPVMLTSCKKEVNGKDKPYKCDYPGCGRSFSFPAHLRSHVQQIHISYRPCKCDFPGCGKRFYTPQHLNVHRRIHTGERPFVCPYANCGKAFTTAGNLKNHIRTHTGERPYACKFDGCSKRFAEMSSLKKHELTHTGEKPYKCRVCGKAFSQAGSRNTHERKHNRTDGDLDSKISRRYRIKRVSQDEEM